MRVFTVWVVGFALAILGATPWASADSLTFNLDYAFSGGPSTPGAVVQLDDVAANQVKVTLDVTAFSAFKFNDWYLNLDPALTIGSFSAGTITGQTPDSIDFGTNAFKADGDGFFDLNVTYDNDPSGSLTGGETTSFIVTYGGAGTFNVHSFDFFSVEGGGTGTYRAAVHVTALADGASVWMGDPGTVIPLPGAAVAGLALMGLVGLRRRYA